MNIVKCDIATTETHCHTCGCSLKYTVTLSDGNVYGINCANNVLGRPNYCQRYFPKIVNRYGVISDVPLVINITNGFIDAKTEAAAIKRVHEIANRAVVYQYRKPNGAWVTHYGTYIGTKKEITTDRISVKLIEQ